MQQNAPQLIPVNKLADHPQNPRIALREDVVDAILAHWRADRTSYVTVRLAAAVEAKLALRGGMFTGEFVNKTNIQWLNDWRPIANMPLVFEVWGAPIAEEFSVAEGAQFFRAADLGMAAAGGVAVEAEPAAPDELQLDAYTGSDHVYFLQAQSLGLIKIGTSSNVSKRIAALQTASPDALTVLGCIPGDCEIERSLHARFAEERVRGEWFTPSERLVDFIDGVTK